MSEYQYYDFLSIDRPLATKEMAELRTLSTRATITPVSFTNVYNWGDFAGNPAKLMEKYFDIHVYIANWMTAVLMVRLPIDALPAELTEVLSASEMMEFRATRTHWLITWYLEESEDYDQFGADDGRGWMGRLAPVRDELLRGDIRSLYIGWLAAVSRERLDEAELEPIVPEGLKNLTAAQKSLAEFLKVEEDLITGAGMDTPPIKKMRISEKEEEEWLCRLQDKEIKELLKLLLVGKAQEAERKLKNQYNEWCRNSQKKKSEPPRRTVGKLWKNAETAKQTRLEQERIEQEKREKQLIKKRNNYLKLVARNFPLHWQKVKQFLRKGSSTAYDAACGLLIDLSDAYSLYSNHVLFEQELTNLMVDYMHRRSLIRRLSEAGIWDKYNKKASSRPYNDK